jgi:two-component system CitB family sensor kinase
MENLLRKQISNGLLNVANTIAEGYVVKEYFSNNKQISQTVLNSEIENIRKKINVQYIVIMDMNGIRITHPVKQQIGKKFQGGDEYRVLSKGEEYISEARGSLGRSFRAFTPIYEGKKQVGAVAVGILIKDFDISIYKKLGKFSLFIIIGLSLGIVGAIIISYNIKKTIYGLEPEEIALILKQKETVLESIREGIITVDNKGNITLFNKEARNILGLTEEVIGKPIYDFVNGSKVKEILESGESLENVEVKVRPGVSIISKHTPLKNEKNEVIGIVINFRNLTEVKALAEELTGIKKVTWSLRAQNHEFMNKLHTIAGLIELEEYDEALQFINHTARESKNISTIITKNIKNVPVAALLLSKYSKAEETRIKFIIDKESRLDNLPSQITSEELVSILGNLLENSLDEVKTDGSGNIYLKIYEEDEKLKIILKDNGPGIKESIRNTIYDRGITSKEGQRGYGMYVVKSIIDETKGNINFIVDKGTTWYIQIPIEKGENYD